MRNCAAFRDQNLGLMCGVHVSSAMAHSEGCLVDHKLFQSIVLAVFATRALV
jgi:hypothetical protein